MADMLSSEQLIQKKKEHPDAVVIAYVNSSAAVKQKPIYVVHHQML